MNDATFARRRTRSVKNRGARRRTAATSCTGTGRLLLHPLPDPLESDLGYGLRLAEINGFARLKTLFAMLGMTPTFAVVLGKDLVHAIASGLRRLSATELEAAIAATDSLAGIRPFTSATRFCPRCLAESGVWKAEWDLPLSIACSHHGLELRSACDECGAPVSYFAYRRLSYCRCGRDFRKSSASPAPRWYKDLETVFRPWLLEGAPKYSYGELYELDRASAIVLQRLVWEASGSRPLRCPRTKVARIPAASFSTVGALLSRWPDGLHASLRRRAESWTAPQRGELVRLLRRSASPLVLEAVNLLLGSIGEIRSTVTARRPTLRAEPPGPELVTLESVRRALAAGGNVTIAMFEAGEMKRATIALHTRIKWVDQEELHFANWLRRYMPRLNEAAEFLGCSEARLRWLVRAGLLPVGADRRFPALARVRVSDMARLMGQLTLHSTKPSGSLDSYIAITDIGSSSTRLKWCELVRRALHGEEEVFQLGRESLGLANFAVRREVALKPVSARGQVRASQSR